jgi:hypothetical protein
MKGIPHEAINASKGVYVKKGIYHVQRVNSYHNRLKAWMERFKGVATKNLNNYLTWHRFLELHKKMPKSEQATLLLLQVCQRANFDTVSSLRCV